MNINEALEYIHSVNWTFCKPGLERTYELCMGLGNPQNNLKFIHVAGTNGKGSFCSMLSSVLIAQGYRVGLYTSPYIMCFNERMQINGEMIRDDELCQITEKIKPIADKMEDKPTEFELVTAIAVEYFSKNNCDYVVLECGLGGRLDSTNVISTSVLSVITGISLDHTAILGNTESKIAKEKAGIIKEGVPCLWCGESKEAYASIKEAASKKNSPLYLVDRTKVNVKLSTLDGTFFDFDEYKGVKINLLGEYQIINAANVLSAVKILKEAGIKIDESSVYTGMANAKWLARFEKLLNDPLVIFDGGHNPEGVDSCVKSVKNYFGEEKLVLLTGILADKDYSYIGKTLGKIASEVHCITPINPRALSSKDYGQLFLMQGIPSFSYESIGEGVKNAIDSAKKQGKALLCTGSLYLYSYIYDEIKKY